MAAGKYNFTVEQGTTVDFAVNYKDSESNPIDISGYQARMQLRPEKGSSILYLTLSSSLDSTYTGLNLSGSGGSSASTPPSSGSIGVYISAVSSSMLDFEKAFYDLELVYGSGNTATVTRVLEGTITLNKEVTKGIY
jgi:hypothetical protein